MAAALRIASLLPALAALALFPSSRSQEFDVASLKPVELTPGRYSANLGTVRHGHEVILTNVTLADCLRFAYGITNDAQIDGPAWIRSKEIRFNIEAKAQHNTSRDQLLVMLQNLLAERFRLVLHREQRELTVLRLVVAKNGPKFHEAKPDASGSGNRAVPGAINSDRISMPLVATLLSRFLREPILDETGLTGAYEIHLEWSPEIPAGPQRPATEPPPGPSIFAAVQEQLGLKLERRKGPLEVLVIDHADRQPIAN